MLAIGSNQLGMFRVVLKIMIKVNHKCPGDSVHQIRRGNRNNLERSFIISP